MRTVFIGVGVLLCVAAQLRAGDADILIADFEGDDYGAWKTTGEAFGKGPARGTLPHQMPVSGFLGKGLVNSFFSGDGTTGTLTSPAFKIERKFINFLIGGGEHPGQTCIALLVDDKTVRTATGPNDRPGGTEALDWHSWDVAEFAGKMAVIQIVDQATGGWGHINVDHIVQGDQKKQANPPVAAEREIVIERPYLHLPVKNGAPQVRMRFEVEGKIVREFTIELATAEPDFLVCSDVTAFKGKTLKVSAKLPGGPKPLEAIVQADDAPGAATLYKEKLRPQFHFSPRIGWTNDPNGMVYHKGEYHLYFQHNPYGWKWGNMHWGHAVSPDLVHWKELPVAIYPFRFDDWVFSGSAVVDKDNTAGFKKGDEDVIVAAYTSTGRGEAIVYSNDRGRTFSEYDGNPVVKHGGRDPKLIWYALLKHWVMAVYDEHEGKRWIAFHTSPDLKSWKLESRIEGFFECPEIFELPVDGDKAKTRWVVYAADGQYAVGTFDGKTFTTEAAKRRFHYGNCFYASQTFNNIPESDGRRIQIAWGQIATPGMPFNQCMLFPVELTLRTTGEGLRLCAVPAREIEKLRAKEHALKDAAVKDGEAVVSSAAGELLDIQAEFELGDAKEFGVAVRGATVAYDVAKGQLRCQKCSGPLPADQGKVRLRILVDRTSIEVFGNDGLLYMPVGSIQPEDNRRVEVFAKGGSAKLTALQVYELRSVWEAEK